MSFLRQILLLCVLAAVSGGGYFAYERYFTGGDAAQAKEGGGKKRGGRGGPQRIEVAEVVVKAIADRVEAVGTTRARQSVEIVPLASGRVTEITFEAGARVEAGSVMVRLDDDIERANLVEAEARLLEATATLARAQKLRKKKNVSAAAVTEATANRAIADAAVERARRKLADRTITAPFSGQAGLRRIDIGARLDPNTMITTLDDLSEAEIEFSVPELLFGRLRPGTKVSARGAAFPGRTFDGMVSIVDSRIDPVARAFKVRARLPNPEGVLPAGMFMYLEAVTGQREALIVPEVAVTVQGSGSFVFVIDDGMASKRPVTLGQRRVGEVEVTEGLTPGEFIAISGLQKIRDGKPVQVTGEHADKKLATMPKGEGG